MVEAHHTTSDEERQSAFIHREMLQLGVLVVFAVVSFLLTRAVAGDNRATNLRDADEWYRRGQQEIAAGRVGDAIVSFRHAAVRNRGEKRFVLALARELAANRDDEAARSALLTLRESAPEDPEINLDLARLSASRQDVTEAVRFYRNALYAPWPPDQEEARRRIRIELVRFLLDHQQTGRAIADILALTADLPDDLPHHMEAAQLFARAGDSEHALEQFRRALRLDPDNGQALAGAGQAAFEQREYALARQYLRRAPDTEEVRRTRDVVDLVLSRDPLAPRLGSAERRRRLEANLGYAQDRLASCLAQRSSGALVDEADALRRESAALEDDLRKPGTLEQDTIENGVDLIDRIERRVVDSCGPAGTLDQALRLIERLHGGDSR